MQVCASCQQEFVKLAGGKRYNRSSLRTLLSPTTCKTIYKIDEHHYANSYICHDCESELKKNTVPEQKGGKKRKLPLPPTNIKQGEKRKKKITSTQSTIDNAIKHLKDYRYDLAIRCLCKDIPAAKKAVVEACCRVLQGEKKKLTKMDSWFNNDVTEANLENFSWKEALEESKGCAPATIGCLTAMLPEAKTLRTQKMKGPRSERRMQTMEEAQHELDTRKGVLVSIILYTTKPKKHKFIATSLGIEMWRLGCPEKVFRCLNHFGICQSIAAARGHIDRLRTGQDMPILAWKESAEKRQKSNFAVAREKRKVKKGKKGAKAVSIEDLELLSQKQLKHKLERPKNNITVSGKRKRRMLKRLRHSNTAKRKMDVDEPSTSHGGGTKEDAVMTDLETKKHLETKSTKPLTNPTATTTTTEDAEMEDDSS